MKRGPGLFMVKYYSLSLSPEKIIKEWQRDHSGIKYDPSCFKIEKDAFDRYFRGEKTNFSQIKLDMSAGTPFQKEVWMLTREIPYGITQSYKSIAEAMGHKGYQSIGGALHENPWLIIVPCHRVVRTDGGLGGFGAGLKVKQKLLDLEMKFKD